MVVGVIAGILSGVALNAFAAGPSCGFECVGLKGRCV
jgi:hypothetical protein